jgi:hypothetical protein
MIVCFLSIPDNNFSFAKFFNERDVIRNLMFEK